MIESKGVMSPTADLKKEIPDGFQIAQMFRNHVNLGNTKAAFAAAATLQGETAPSDSQNQDQSGQSQKRQKCFDIRFGRHSIERCYYLNKDLRPEGWQMSLERAKLMMQGLQRNKELRDKYKDAYKEIEAFLKDHKKKDEKDSKPQAEKTTEDKPKTVIGSASVGIASFATQDTSFSTSSYPLSNSFILDCGFPVYICNDLNRFDPSIY